MAQRLPRAGFEVPIAVNDNTSALSGAEDRGPQGAPEAAHVYVGSEALAANSNEGAHVYVQSRENIESCFLSAREGEAPQNTQDAPGSGLKIFSDFPHILPILPQEIALIETYLLDLIAKVHANDNEEV